MGIEEAMMERQPNDARGRVRAALDSMSEEADAASKYMGRSRLGGKDGAVYRDIAKEEMTHMGEAAELLSDADPELAKEVPKGMEEAKEIKPPSGWRPDIDSAMADEEKGRGVVDGRGR